MKWGRKRWLLPSLLECFLLAILVWLFVAGASGWKALLMDGDTGWHIRNGEYILDHHAAPVQDIFSFSKPGAPWYSWEWLADTIFGLLFRLAGLKGVVLFSGVLIAAYAATLLRISIWYGANVSLALPFTMLAVGASSMHFLARPHLYTLLLLPIALWVVARDRRTSGPALWWLVPLTAVWANLHGGFVMFLACLAILLAGVAVEAWFGRNGFREVQRYGLLLAACSAATLLNPYGFSLHIHVAQYLSAGWIRDLVQEFQAPAFRSEGQIQFQFLLLAGLALSGWLLAKRKAVEALLILFLAQASLTSVRHAPLFAAVAAPIVAAELSALWESTLGGRHRTAADRLIFDMGRDLRPAFCRFGLWAPAAIAILACLDAPVPWPKDFPAEAFPIALVHRQSKLLTSSRPLTTDQWADYLIYSFYPRQRVFFDGRSDFYGEAMGRDYLALMNASYSADRVLDRYQFDAALLPVEWPLATLLKNRAGWRTIEDDGKAILFVRSLPVERDSRAHRYFLPVGLMESTRPAELMGGDSEDMRSARKPKHDSNRKSGSTRKARTPVQLPEIDTWRLPSGQRLPEFALSAGFLAPPLLSPEETADAAPSASDPSRGMKSW